MASATWADLEKLQVGDSAACEMAVTEADVDAYARLSQDDNPLHMDESVARQHGFAGRVAHGMLALSAISRLIGTQLPGPGALWLSQELEFVTPVLAGDRLAARVTVQRISRGARVVVLSTEVVNAANQAMVLRGVAKVRIPQRNIE